MALARQLAKLSMALLGAALIAGCSVDDVAQQRSPEAGISGHSQSDLPVQTAPGYRVEAVLVDLCEPMTVTLDREGNLYVAEQGAGPGAAPPRILRVSPAGHIDVLTDKLNGPVHCIRWENERLIVWDGKEVASFGAQGEVRRPAGQPAQAPPRRAVSAGGEFGAQGDWFVISGGQVIRRSADGDQLFLWARDGTMGIRRLADLAFGPGDKALYVADLGPITATSPTGPAIGGNGIIWRITRIGSGPQGPPAQLSPPQQLGVGGQTTRPGT